MELSAIEIQAIHDDFVASSESIEQYLRGLVRCNTCLERVRAIQQVLYSASKTQDGENYDHGNE